jgi:26S proteasome regulatory subunit T6
MVKGSSGPPPSADRGIRSYYASKIDELELTIREKTQNLQRLKAQRNEWNAKGELSTRIRNACAQ